MAIDPDFEARTIQNFLDRGRFKTKKAVIREALRALVREQIAKEAASRDQLHDLQNKVGENKP